MIKQVFDPVIHAPNRLQICALLTPLDEAEFLVLREELGVSESVISKHIGRLQQAGYIRIRSGAINGRAHKWASLTTKGRKAFTAHVKALQNLVSLSEEHKNPV